MKCSRNGRKDINIAFPNYKVFMDNHQIPLMEAMCEADYPMVYKTH